MKQKIFLVATLILAFLTAMPLSMDAANNKKNQKNKWAKNKLDLHQIHNLAMWGGVGYSGLVNNYKNDGTSRFVGGVGGMVGLGYEWHYKKFMLALGPEFRLFSSQDRIPFNATDNPFSIVGSDPASVYVLPGQTKFYQFDKLKETQTVGQIMLPIMAGAQFNESSVPLYFLAGAKVGYTLMHSYAQRGMLTTYIHDESAFDPTWGEVRDLRTDDYASRGKNGMGLDVALSAEIGVNIDNYLDEEWKADNDKRKYPWHMRAALFVDYGLPLTKLGTADPMVTVTESQAQTISLHSSNYAPSALNSLLVGAKFTALLQLSKPKLPKPQNPYMVIQVINGRTGKPMTAPEDKVNFEVKSLANNKIAKRGASNNKAMFIQRLKPAEYEVSVSKEGFLPYAPFRMQLIEAENNDLKKKLDTTRVVLYPAPTLTCRVVNAKTQEPIMAHISVIDTTDSKKILEFETLKTGGITRLPVGETYYNALVEAKDFQTRIYPIGVQGMDDIVLEFELDPVLKGRTFVIKNLFFASNQTEILPQSEAALQELYEFLVENPDVRIRITGHTDWVGTDADNMTLSEGRANSVKRSMIERGIAADRIEAEGKGESQPIDTNETEEGRANNRRVEFTVISTEGANSEQINK